MTLVAEIKHLIRVRDDLLRPEIALGNEIGAIERRLARAGKDDVQSVTQMEHVQSYLAVPALHHAKAHLHAERLPVELLIKKLVWQLPTWPWIDDTRGLGEISAAQIIAMASGIDPQTGRFAGLERFSGPAKLWVMCSVGIVDGQPQRKVANNPRLAERLRYDPRRRAVMVVIGDNLIRQNRDGSYRQAYLIYKAREVEKAAVEGLKVAPADKIPKGKSAEYRSVAHIHKRARLHMVKDLLRDFWTEWMAANTPVSPSAPVLPSN